MRDNDCMVERLFITGIAGFIGRNLAKEALAQGFSVKGMDIADMKEQLNVEFVKADIRDTAKVEAAMKGADYVVHLAAITSNVEFEKGLKECYDTNITGFMNVIEAARRNNVKKFLYASSAAVYTDKSGFSEDSVISMQEQKSHYAKSKLMNEMIAKSYADAYGMETIGMRLFNVYGPGENEKGDYASIISRFMKDSREGRPLLVYGDGNQARDFVYVEDAAKIILELLGKAQPGVYNVGTGKAVSYTDIAKRINADALRYVRNPLSSYQYLTRSDSAKLRAAIGDYRFTDAVEWIAGSNKPG